MRELLIPLDRCITASYGHDATGHCAAGWLAFVTNGTHYNTFGTTRVMAKLIGLVGLASIATANDCGTHETVVQEFAKLGIEARYVPSATDEEILAAWRGVDEVDREWTAETADRMELAYSSRIDDLKEVR